MATRKIVSKHIAQSASSYVGRKGELILDTITNELKISDGSTAGGTILNTDGSSGGGGGASTGNYTFSGNVISNGSSTITVSGNTHTFNGGIVATGEFFAGGPSGTGKAGLSTHSLRLGRGENDGGSRAAEEATNYIDFLENTREGGSLRVYGRRPQTNSESEAHMWIPNHAAAGVPRYFVTTAVDGGALGATSGLTGNLDTFFDPISFSGNTISTNASNADLELDANGTGAVSILTQVVRMANLPTSDPTSAGQLWNDGGALKISAG